MTNTEWQEEIRYIHALLESGGNRNVPADCVVSYLQVQAKNATGTDREHLLEIAFQWGVGHRDTAKNIFATAFPSTQGV